MNLIRITTVAMILLSSGCASKEPEKPTAKVDNMTIKEGEGVEVKLGDRVHIHYTGKLTNGTKFDSSLERNMPFVFRVGSQEAVPGFSDAVLGMKVGGKRMSTIPYQLAYGEQGRQPKIPPKSDLVFEIELLKIEE